MNSRAEPSDSSQGSFDADFAACTSSPSDPIGPTCEPDVVFGVRLLGASESCVAADCVTPHGDGNPGHLTTLIDLLLARGALGTASPNSCVTLRMDLNVHPERLAAATRVRGLARNSFDSEQLAAATCELRADNGTLVATGMGLFVTAHGTLPLPFEATEPESRSSLGLASLLEIKADSTREFVTWSAREWTANPSGVVHGGVQAAALVAGIEGPRVRIPKPQSPS